MVRVRHASGYQTAYLHLSAFAPGLRVGQRLAQGDFIGRVGTSGAKAGVNACPAKYTVARRSGSVKRRELEERAAQEAGIPFNEDTNSGNQEGVGYIQGAIHRGRRQSTAAAYLRPAEGRANLTVRTGEVTRRGVPMGEVINGAAKTNESKPVNNMTRGNASIFVI